MKEVEQEIEARERAQATQAASSQSSRRPPREIPHSAATLLSGTSSMNCCYCQQAHVSEACGVVKQIEARKQILRKSGRCFICLRRGHIGRECRSRSRCGNCSGRHHASICANASPPKRTQDATTPSMANPHSATSHAQSRTSGLNPDAASFEVPTTASMYVGADKTTLLQTAQVLVYNLREPESLLKIRAVLDTGSQKSYVTDRVKDVLRLDPEETQRMSIATFGSSNGGPRSFGVVRVGMKLSDGLHKELKLIAVPSICEPLAAQPITLCLEKYSHLKQLNLADSSTGDETLHVDVLIGADYYWELVTGQMRKGDEGPVAVYTRLGWVLSGPASMVERRQDSVSLMTTHALHIGAPEHNTENLDQTLQSFWELESLGINQPDRCVFTEFEEKIHYKDARYEVSLPWKDVHPHLPDNYQLALKRLRGLQRRLQQQPSLLREYDSIIQDQLKQGIIQAVEDPQPTDGRMVHYLPHHGVIRQDKKTTKLRVVYDASAKTTGPSLNDCLYTGPKFDQKIIDILLRFRTMKVALTADIERAFLMIAVCEADRDVLRFLWFDDITKDRPQVCAFRFARVVFGVSSSPFLLNATIRHHLKKYLSSHPQLVNSILQAIYVDDIVGGAETEEKALTLYKESKALLRTGGFNLRKFTTNSSELQERIDREEGVHVPGEPSHSTVSDETYTKSTLGNTQRMRSGEHKTLGVRWCVDTDRFVMDVSDIGHLAKGLEPTKRNIVSLVGRIYDPLGFLAPAVIRLKCLFQELCGAKLGWDQPLTGGLLRKWNSMILDLRGASPVSIPRYLLYDVSHEVESYSLSGFCDASKRAYAAVVYLRVKTSVGYTVRFLASKTRVTPLRDQTIPRLELLSALLLARLVTSIKESLASRLPLSDPTCYTDSRVALYWIQGTEREWKQFVQNRADEIRKLLPSNCWRHGAGESNPADLPSRGLPFSELATSKRWREGPDWLRNEEVNNYEEDTSESVPEECAPELKARERKLLHNLMVTESQLGLNQLMDCKQYSSLHRLLRVSAYVLRFVEELKRRIKDKNEHRSPTPIGANELAHTETLWVKESQTCLTKDRNFACWKRQFGLFVDPEGLWRCGGRLSNANISYAAKHPILLPKDQHLTTLLVVRAHERVSHDGVKETLTELRSRYWLVKGRSFVKKILRRCSLCRRFEGKPYSAPPPPPLPEFRVRMEPPFTSTGVDFAGPLHIKNSDSTRSRRVWICLYTCCVIRAVHLDVVPDLTTSSFLRSLKRFSARRGLPQRMISDNGATFKAADESIQATLKHNEVQRHLAGLGVEWKFNVERAPWWGGIFERMVRSTKRCLKKTKGRAKLTYDELLTAVTEVEMVINSRPLTYVSSDDLQEPLTPSHFLTGRRTLSLPDSLCCGQDMEDDDVELTHDHLTKRMRHLNVVLNQFWKRWSQEYLLELRESHRHQAGTSDPVTVAVGDIVLVHEDKPRAFWKLARVKELIRGRDGKIRGACLAVSSAKGNTTTLQRPIQLLYPLEVNGQIEERAGSLTREPTSEHMESEQVPEADTENRSQNDEQAPNCVGGISTVRPKRAAALRARERVKQWTCEDDSF